MIQNESSDNVVDNSHLPMDADATEAVVAPVEITEEIPQEKEAEGEEVKAKRLGGWQRKNAKLEKEVAELRKQLETTAKPADKEPQLEDYKDWNAYSDAKIEYKLDQRLKAQKEVAKESDAEITWDAKIEALPDDKYEEFQAMLEDYKDVDIRQQILKSTQNSSVGPEILLYLDKNPELFDKLNHKDISDLSIKREIAAIEAKLSNPEKPTVKGSKSPAPITPIRGSSPTSVDDKDLDTDAYIAKYHSRLLKK